MSLLVPILLLGGGGFLATKVLSSKPNTANAPGAPASPQEAQAQFSVLVEKMPGGSNANPAYAEFFARTQPAEAIEASKLATFASRLKEAWSTSNASTLREAAASLAMLGMTPTVDPKSGDAALRTDLMQLGALAYQRATDKDLASGVTGSLPDRTRFSPSEAIVENTGWFTDMQTYMGETAKVANSTPGSKMDPDKTRGAANELTQVWLSGSPKDLLGFGAMLVATKSALPKAAQDAATHASGLYRIRATRLGATPTELAEFETALKSDPMTMMAGMAGMTAPGGGGVSGRYRR